jgi:ubiquinone/menaquinone biosynthesis C-methylase UbiE
VAEGFTRVTVVDISDAALQVARARLGQAADAVTWVVGDARHMSLLEQVDLWHDRAVFHFLTSDTDQDAYLSSLRRTVRVGGHVIIATFGPGGPEKCSGLPVQRYEAEALSARLGAGFAWLRFIQKHHVTPSGVTQEFIYGLFYRTA